MDMGKYQALLKWSLQYQDGTGAPSAKAMDPETKKWLQEAIESQVVSVSQQMEAIIKILKVPRNESGDEEQYVDNKCEALLALHNWVDNLDFAKDFYKIGGYEVLLKLCTDTSVDIRIAAMENFATIVQNNPECQEWGMQMGALDMLMGKFSVEGITDSEQAKVLFAIASLIRGHSKATLEFVKDPRGVSELIKAIHGETAGPRTKRKCLFLMRYIFHVAPVVKEALALSLVKSFNKGLESDDIDICENSLYVLISLYTDRNVVPKIDKELVNSTKSTLSEMKGLDQMNSQLVHQLNTAVDAAIAGEVPQDAPASENSIDATALNSGVNLAQSDVKQLVESDPLLLKN